MFLSTDHPERHCFLLTTWLIILSSQRVPRFTLHWRYAKDSIRCNIRESHQLEAPQRNIISKKNPYFLFSTVRAQECNHPAYRVQPPLYIIPRGPGALYFGEGVYRVASQAPIRPCLTTVYLWLAQLRWPTG